MTEIPGSGPGQVALAIAEFCALMLTGVLAGVHVAGPAGLNRALRSPRGDLPINREMAAWRADAPPVDWQDVWARWERFFVVRVVAATVAFGCVAVAVLVPG